MPPLFFVMKRIQLSVTLTASLMLSSQELNAQSAPPHFVHPGVLIDGVTMESGRNSIEHGDKFKVAALTLLRDDRRASLGYEASPVSRVECGPYSKPDIGCSAEISDAQAAYSHALLWVYLKDERHARKAAEIMNAWSSTLSQGHALSNAPLQAAWAAQMWTRAAEIIAHTSDLWPASDVQKFKSYLLQQYLPDIQKMGHCLNGNWYASRVEAKMNIAIFTDRRDLYDSAVREWRERVPAYIYAPGDGKGPLPDPECNKNLNTHWHGQSLLAPGVTQETCRDLTHTAMGLSAISNAAETDRIQGGTLFQDSAYRLVAAMEFHSTVLNRKQPPEWLCGGKLSARLSGTLEISYAYYAGVLGVSMPQTAKWLSHNRPSRGTLHMLWETLTHGIPIVADDSEN